MPFGGHNWRSTGGQSLKSTVLDLWVSSQRFLVLGNPSLAQKYCSNVTEGHNCHLEVIIGGQLFSVNENVNYIYFFNK